MAYLNSTTIAGTGFTSATTAGTNIVGTLSTNGLSLGIPAYLTTAATGGGGGVAISAGTKSTSTGTVVFSNANGISFGMDSAANITASYTVPTQTAYVFSNSNNVSFGTNASTVTASASFNQTVQPAVGLNTAQTNVTWTVNSSGISINAGGYAGTSTGFAGNNISGSITNNSNGINISLSNPAWITTAAQSNQVVNALVLGTATNAATNQSSSLIGSLSLSNLNGISFYTTVSGAVSGVAASYTVPSTAGLLSNIKISAGTASNNLSALTFSDSNGVSFGLNGSVLTATVQTNFQNASLYFLGNTTAQSSSSSYVDSVMSFGAIGPVSMGYSSNSGVVVSVGAPGLNTAQTNVTWTVNSSGISLNASGYAGTGLTLNVTNLSTSATLNSNGLNLSINNIDDHVKGFQLYGNTSGTSASTFTTTQPIYLQGGNGITLSGSSDSIVISAQNPGGTTFWTNSYFMWPQGAQYVGTSSLTIGNSSMYVQPFQLQAPISASYIRHLVSLPAFGSSTQATTGNATITNDWYATFYANIFSQGVGANSRSLQLVNQATAGMTHRWAYTINAGSESVVWRITYPQSGANTNNSGVSYSQTSANINWSTTGAQTNFTGLRWLDIPYTQSLSPGQYWIQFQRSTNSATTGGNMANSTGLTTNMTVINVTQASIAVGPFGNSIGSTDGLQLGLGVYSTNSSGGTTNSMSFGGISTVANQPMIPFQIIRQA